MELPIEQIDLGDNPRTRITSDSIDDLAASIKLHGVIQPVIVHPDGLRYTLIAGQRRLLAATAAGLATVPAVVRDTTTDTTAVALVENLQRVELTPIEEAHAFKAAIAAGMSAGELALAISRSEQLVKDRVALLELPEQVQGYVARGELTLGAAAALRVLEAAGDRIVAKAAELIATPAEYSEDQLLSVDLERNPGYILDRVLSDLDGDAPFLVSFHKGRRLSLDGYDRIEWPDGFAIEDLRAKLEKLPPRDASYREVRGAALLIDQDDVDAARAYGAVFELGDEMYVTDAEWLRDRLDQKADKAAASWVKKQKAAAKKAAKDAGVDVATGDDPEKALRDAKRADNAAKAAEMLAARERNISLGVSLYKGLHAPPVTADALRILGLLILEYAAEGLGRRGIRYVDEQFQTVATRKDGSISRVTYQKGWDVYEPMMQARLERAETPEQILGVLLQAIVAARYADETAASRADRQGDVRGLLRWDENEQLVLLVEKIAGPHLPPDVVIAIEADRADEPEPDVAEAVEEPEPVEA